MSHKVKVSLRVEMPFFVQNPVRHNLEVELEYDPNHGAIVVQGSLPATATSTPKRMFEGTGRGLLGAVLDWLRQVDQSVDYIPAHTAKTEQQIKEASRNRLEAIGIWPIF